MDNHNDFYLSLRDRVMGYLRTEDGQKHKYADYVLLLPDFFYLLYNLLIDKDVPSSDKIKLGAAIAYFVSPVDVIPEAVFGALGYVDDLSVAAVVLNGIMSSTSPEVIRRHWVGDGDVLEQIQRVISSADEMIGTGALKKIMDRFGSR